MPDQPQELRDGFRFRGGHPALDLTATLTGRLKPTQREWLATPADLDRWLIAAGLGEGVGNAGPSNLETAHILREAIYALAMTPDAAARTTINRIAAGTPAILRFDTAGDAALVGTSGAMLVSLARDAILLFGGESRVQVRQCAGEGCAILFVDQSRKGDRRWCSMAACGNKAKAAQFRRRAKRSAG